MINLDSVYAKILTKFGLEEFSSKEFEKHIYVDNPNLILHRLYEKGFIVRFFRGKYKAIHPLILVLEKDGWKWKDKISQKEYLPILEFVVVRLIEAFWKKLVSLIIFGSIASGKAKNESDLDFLLVAENLPKKYSERLKLIRKILTGVEDVRIKIWREKGRYPLLDIIILGPQEAKINHPFYLDLVEESIIVFDRENFMKNRLESLKKELGKLGAKRILLPNGRWYWDLKTEISRGEVIQL